MQDFILFGGSVFLSLCAWSYVCYQYIWPKIKQVSRISAYRTLLVPHLFRFVGASFAISGVANAALPQSFAIPAAYGDLLAAALAWVSILLLRHRAGIAAMWIFNVWGTADLCFAFYRGAFGKDFKPAMLGATFYIPTVVVPLLLCMHAMLFVLLITGSRAQLPRVQAFWAFNPEEVNPNQDPPSD